MQDLEIKEVQSGAIYRVRPDGAVIGREGAKADIVIKNPSVSKRHARIFQEGGEWFLEDLGSSNGTFFANQRISAPVVLPPGTLFALAEIQFEVSKKGQEAVGKTGRVDPRLRGPTSARLDEALLDPDLLGNGASAPPLRGEAPPRAELGRSIPAPASNGSDEVERGSPTELFGGLGRGIAFHLLNAPKLFFNPMGTVRRAIEAPPLDALGPWALAGYALPALAAASALGLIVSIIVGLIVGGFSIGTVLSQIIGAAVGTLLGSIIGGFLAHPVMRWIIDRCGGQSDAGARSNWFVLGMSGSVLTAIPGALTAVLAFIPVPFIGVAPVVLGVYASLVSLAVPYLYLKHFGVARWLQLLPAVAAALVLLGGVFNTLGAVRGGTALAGATAGGADAVGAMKEAEKRAAEARALGEAAQKAAEKAPLAQVGPVPGETPTASKEPVPTPEPTARVSESPTPRPSETPRPAETPRPSETTPSPSSRPTEPAAPLATASPEPRPGPELSTFRPPSSASEAFRRYVNHRDAIERAIEEDPTLLLRVKGLQPAYERYLERVQGVRDAYALKRKGKREPAWKDKLHERLLAAELFEGTKGGVEEMFGLLYGR